MFAQIFMAINPTSIEIFQSVPNDQNCHLIAMPLAHYTVMMEQHWPWTASLWQVLHRPLSTFSCPVLSGPGSIHAQGLPRYGQGPSSPTPSLIQCTAAGQWRREQREHLEQAEWWKRGDRGENLSRHPFLLNRPGNDNKSLADYNSCLELQIHNSRLILSIPKWDWKKYSTPFLFYKNTFLTKNWTLAIYPQVMAE